jgi:hypothetical protein
MLARALPVFAAVLVLSPIALADGGPDPGVVVGGAGITGASGEVRYVAAQAGSFTALEKIAAGDGRVLGSTVIRGGWGIPVVDYGGSVGGLSTNGATLVLGQTGAGSCTPSGCTLLRRTTSFQVINPATLRRQATVTLRGDFAYDALSPDGRRLYLIQHSSSSNANRYVVRAYDLRRHRLLPGTIADRTQRGWLMQGTPMARATSKDGRYVYTLYANSGGYPFIHALDAVAASAHCIGIPWVGDTVQGDLAALELSPNGRELTIGTTAGHPYFTVDTGSYRVTTLPAAPAGALP